MLIAPMIRKTLTRDDLSRLVAEIAHTDPAEGYTAARALEAGRVDVLLDSPVALEAVRGRGGAPAPVPLTLLWYVPVRAYLRQNGEEDIDLADFTASLPLAFLTTRAGRRIGFDGSTLDSWAHAIEAMPPGTVARAECAAYCGALALWWAGLFPERVARRGRGHGMIRAYVDFAATVLRTAGRALHGKTPGLADLYHNAADRIHVVRSALAETRVDYLGRDAHTPSGRLDRFLERLDPTDPRP